MPFPHHHSAPHYYGLPLRHPPDPSPDRTGSAASSEASPAGAYASQQYPQQESPQPHSTLQHPPCESDVDTVAGVHGRDTSGVAEDVTARKAPTFQPKDPSMASSSPLLVGPPPVPRQHHPPPSFPADGIHGGHHYHQLLPQSHQSHPHPTRRPQQQQGYQHPSSYRPDPPLPDKHQQQQQQKGNHASFNRPPPQRYPIPSTTRTTHQQTETPTYFHPIRNYKEEDEEYYYHSESYHDEYENDRYTPVVPVSSMLEPPREQPATSLYLSRSRNVSVPTTPLDPPEIAPLRKKHQQQMRRSAPALPKVPPTERTPATAPTTLVPSKHHYPSSHHRSHGDDDRNLVSTKSGEEDEPEILMTPMLPPPPAPPEEEPPSNSPPYIPAIPRRKSCWCRWCCSASCCTIFCLTMVCLVAFVGGIVAVFLYVLGGDIISPVVDTTSDISVNDTATMAPTIPKSTSLADTTSPTISPVASRSGYAPPPLSTNKLDVALVQEFQSLENGFGSSVALLRQSQSIHNEEGVPSSLLETVWMAVGSPGADDSTGRVRTYQTVLLETTRQDNRPQRWIPLQALQGGHPNSAFGATMALVANVFAADEEQQRTTSTGTPPLLIVGAPDDDGTQGAVLLYSLDITQAKWVPFPSPTDDGSIDGGTDVASSSRLTSYSLNGSEGDVQEEGANLQATHGQLLGSALAVAALPGSDGNTDDAVLRIIVGAPLFGSQNQGRVYTFELHSSKTTASGIDDAGGTSFPLYGWPTTTTVLQATEANGRLGSAVDITPDGNILAVGQAGVSTVSFYEWMSDEADWKLVQSHELPSSVDFGTSVAFLSSRYLAVGAPSDESTRGSVHVLYRQEVPSTWTIMADRLLGTQLGDRLGSFGTITGSVGPWWSEPRVVTSTTSGSVKRHDFIDGRWVERFSIDVDASVTAVAVAQLAKNQESAISSTNSSSGLYAEEYSLLVGYGGADLAALYEAVPALRSSAPSMQPSISPSIPPSSAPTKKKLIVTSTSSNANSGFGQAVAVTGEFMAVGEPKFSNGVGGTQLFQFRDSNWESVDMVVDVSGARDFGVALDIAIVGGRESLLVGAIESDEVDSSSTDSNAGSAFYFQIEDGEWNRLGEPLSPGNDAAEKFGWAVAMATTQLRVAIGAPLSDSNETVVDSGKVYTFDHNGVAWQRTSVLSGDTGGMLFGTSIDMAEDGSLLLVGAPGVEGGKIYYYNWDVENPGWHLIFSSSPGSAAGEAFGSSVAIVSYDGLTLVAGGPSYGENRGVIRSYRQEYAGGPFIQLGNDLVGSQFESIGRTIGGSNGRIAFGTDTGLFIVVEYDGLEWVEIARLSPGAPVLSLSMSSDAGSVVVGLEGEEVWYYTL